ncbi:MAG: two-component regulator propeller domain-containing protein, partial [Verrucomicrobiota bacterium]
MSTTAANPSFYIRHWQTDDGLPDDNVTSITQTRDGYLWVTTQSGLLRFDGIHFQDLSKSYSEATRNRTFQAAIVDSADKLWLVADSGAVSWLETGGTNMGTVTKGRLLARVQSMVVDGNDGVWVSYGPRIANVLHIQGSEVTSYHRAENFPGSGHCTLARDVRGQLWFAQSTCVGVFRDGRFLKLLTLPAGPMRICRAREGGVWISLGNQIFHFEENQNAVRRGVIGSDPSMAATAMLEDRAGRLWIGSSLGELFCMEGTNVQRVAKAQPEIVSLAEDWEENIWMGTLGGGLSRIRPLMAEVKGVESGLPSPALLSVCEDRSGAIWITTQSGLLARQNGGSWTIVSTNSNWPGGQARCVVADNEGGVWIGTRDGGLHHWQNGDYTTLRTTNGLVSDSVRSLLVSAKGDLWIGMEDVSGLQRLRDGQLHTFKTANGMQSVRAMAEDRAGNIWMGNARGELLKAGKTQISNQSKRALQPPRPIRCLAMTPDQTLWIGYAGGGLGRFKDGKFAFLDVEHGL